MTSTNKKKIALIEKKIQEKLRNKAMKQGVTLISPETVHLSKDTKFGKNVVINQYVVIGKKTKIGDNVEIMPFTHIENSILKSNVKVGPFSRIRPGTLLGVFKIPFPKIEQKKKKLKIKDKNMSEKLISIDEFKKIDLRTAKIIKAEKVEKQP